ncbi:hypothetical protein B4094_3556 [Bacillus licheniformis]|nr:hypothetical protein B4094_3556 [Bacillus licheniformis]TWK64378.1 hypothetical protein CHCC20343_3033 [Bacillus licheniformis]TWL26887.1 hypothetical protein CHCC16874_3277 [Bacillus licheniformis]TWL68831.1 hypothetical protein CHCC15318_1573 [Bacillus licheniformis]
MNVQANKPKTVNAKTTLITVKKGIFVTHLKDFHLYVSILIAI